MVDGSNIESGKSIEAPGKERLGDEEMGNLISASGNSEAKAITLGAMRHGIIYTRGDLHKEVLYIQGEKPGWRINHNGPFSYCEASFEPIGLVAREVTTSSGLQKVGYIKTKGGNFRRRTCRSSD